jgi:hypothetical protein
VVAGDGGARTWGPARRMWARWVGANTIGEAVGLGVTAGVAAALAGLDDTGRVLLVAVVVATLIIAGAFEGVVVGYAQWRVLRAALPTLPWRSWIGATVLGALVAWTLGLVPSTVMSVGGQGGGEPPFDDAVQYLLAAVMGLVLGPVLGVPQWRVLRRFLSGAGWWVPANALAWAAGMPVIFAVAGAVPATAGVATIAGAVLVACAGAGAVVGAVHGVVLVRLLRDADERTPIPS